MDSQDHVHSPSFTLSNQYHSRELSLYHFDFYRLSEPGIMRDEIVEAISDPRAIVVVEWADIVTDTLPDKRLTITVKAVGDTQREFTFSCPQSLSYLLPANT
jgi:tRNA threonylcarbamoyl adenosine modification protein YjeE